MRKRIIKAIKAILIELMRMTIKILASLGITVAFVNVTDLITLANADRPAFAVGGEWILIALVFFGSLYLMELSVKWAEKKPLKKSDQSRGNYNTLFDNRQ